MASFLRLKWPRTRRQCGAPDNLKSRESLLNILRRTLIATALVAMSASIARAQFMNTGTGAAATDPFWSVIYKPVAPFTSSSFAGVLGMAYVPSSIASAP